MSNCGFEDEVDRVAQLLLEDGMDILDDEMLSPIFNENNETSIILPAFLRSGKILKWREVISIKDCN